MDHVYDLLIAVISYGLMPAVLLFVGYRLDRRSKQRTESLDTRNTERSDDVKQALDAEAMKVRASVDRHTERNSSDHSDVVRAIGRLESKFDRWTHDHEQEHRLINEIITH